MPTQKKSLNTQGTYVNNIAEKFWNILWTIYMRPAIDYISKWVYLSSLLEIAFERCFFLIELIIEGLKLSKQNTQADKPMNILDFIFIKDVRLFSVL